MRIAAGLRMMLAAICAQPCAAAAQPTAAQSGIFEDYGNFTTAAEDKKGVVRMALWDGYVRYSVGPLPDDSHRALLFLINRAHDDGRAVMLHYDGARGRLNAATGTLEYPLCTIALDALRFEPPQPCRDQPQAQPHDVAAALPLARAFMSAGRFEEAQALLTRFGPPSETPARELFLTLRAENQAQFAATLPRLSRAADQAYAGALADYRALAALKPSQVEYQFEIGTALRELGAYAEARAVYDAIPTRWPDEDYRVAVGIGALYRAQGDYGKALQALNDLVARKGPQPGMKFHYHRGWALSLLGRFDEAIRELSDGIQEQPDYGSAYERRACAYASVGQLREALADAEQALRLLTAVPAAATVKTYRDEVDEVTALRDRLRAAVAKGDGTPLTGICSGGTWYSAEHPRARSPLLAATG
jgi:tetratricopeptide (TPR) repeat protein